MIAPELHRIDTPLSILHDIPTTFFLNIESATSFSDSLFPSWTNAAFSNQTSLKRKFELIYNKYKAIRSPKTRSKIVRAFSDINNIELLCKGDLSLQIISIKELPKRIQDYIVDAFIYLYNDALNHPPFEKLYSDTISNALDRFIKKNQFQICPICGIEGYHNLAGQSRMELDHWLYKELFPFASVNFDNLIPIGEKCNARPAKGTKNILLDENQKNRVVAYYPYVSNKSITLSFEFLIEPTVNDILDSDWNLKIQPNDSNEGDVFSSWQTNFNINIRYKDFLRKIIFDFWQSNYKSFIDNNPMMTHADNIAEFKQNLLAWKSIFHLKSYPGAILYRSFVDYLIYKASDAYMSSLCENIRRM